MFQCCCWNSQRARIELGEMTTNESTETNLGSTVNFGLISSHEPEENRILKKRLGLGDFPLEIIHKIISYLHGWNRVMFCSTCLRFRQLLLSSGPIWKRKDLAIPLSVDIGHYSILFSRIVDLTIVLTTDNFTSGNDVSVPMKQKRNARDLPFFTSLFPDLTNATIKIVHVYLAVRFGHHRLLKFMWSFDFQSQVAIYPLYKDKSRRVKQLPTHIVLKNIFHDR